MIQLGPPTPVPGVETAVTQTALRRQQPPWRLMLRKPTFIAGALILLFWIFCAVFGKAIAPYNPLAQQLLAVNASPSGAHLF